jgi:hypothetical protein
MGGIPYQVLDPNIQFDYFINVNLVNVLVSPDQTMQRDSVLKRELRMASICARKKGT